jgi:hypothetical protein
MGGCYMTIFSQATEKTADTFGGGLNMLKLTKENCNGMEWNVDYTFHYHGNMRITYEGKYAFCGPRTKE